MTTKARSFELVAKIMLGFGEMVRAGDAGDMNATAMALGDLVTALCDLIEHDPGAAVDLLRGVPGGIAKEMARWAPSRGKVK